MWLPSGVFTVDRLGCRRREDVDRDGVRVLPGQRPARWSL
jgi:hypothetical protein